MSNEEIKQENNISNSKMLKRWFMTYNNPTETDEEFENYLKNLEHFKYATFQREKGANKETEHFQVFLIFTVGKRFQTMKNLFPKCHIEEAKGSNVQCRDYCSKSETRVSGPYEIGEFAEMRGRTDIKNIIELLKNGVDDYTLMELYPSQYFRHKKRK